MISSYTMSFRFYLLIHSWWTNWNCSIQLITRHCTSRYILCSSPLSLCLIYRSSICYHGRICTLISSIYRVHPRRYMSKNSFRYYVCGSQYNIFPSTFPRSFRNATTLLGLPRCLYYMKYSIINGIFYFTYSRPTNNLHNLRSLCFKTRSLNSHILLYKSRMTSRMSTTLPHIWRTIVRESKIRKEGIEPPKIGFKPTP